jgi:endo-1,4-beta-xylanase
MASRDCAWKRSQNPSSEASKNANICSVIADSLSASFPRTECRFRRWLRLWFTPVLLGGCGDAETRANGRGFTVDTSDRPSSEQAMSCDPANPAPPVEMGGMTLAAAFAEHFKIGVAVGRGTFSGDDAAASQLAAQQYNRATPENAFKWQSIQPMPGMFNFGQAEDFLDFAERTGMEVHGHTIVWHQQVPGWVFQGDGGQPATRELLLTRLEEHMAALAERIGARVHYWDVVNEAFNDDGSMRETSWKTIIGDDYLEQAFLLADRYFPDAKLVYNDFSMENSGKRDAVVRMVNDFQAKGIRIDAIGSQGHFRLGFPSLAAIQTSIQMFGETGAEVLITEMDVDVLPAADNNQGADLSVNAAISAQLNPYAECLPPFIEEQAAERWGSIFDLFVQNKDKVRSVTLWGVSDGHSWLNNWPVRGRTNYALLFDRELEAKSSWQAVVDASGSGL